METSRKEEKGNSSHTNFFSFYLFPFFSFTGNFLFLLVKMESRREEKLEKEKRKKMETTHLVYYFLRFFWKEEKRVSSLGFLQFEKPLLEASTASIFKNSIKYPWKKWKVVNITKILNFKLGEKKLFPKGKKQERRKKEGELEKGKNGNQERRKKRREIGNGNSSHFWTFSSIQTWRMEALLSSLVETAIPFLISIERRKKMETPPFSSSG